MNTKLEKIWKQIVCAFIGHQWTEIRVSLVHMIRYRQCERCGYKYPEKITYIKKKK